MPETPDSRASAGRRAPETRLPNAATAPAASSSRRDGPAGLEALPLTFATVAMIGIPVACAGRPTPTPEIAPLRE